MFGLGKSKAVVTARHRIGAVKAVGSGLRARATRSGWLESVPPDSIVGSAIIGSAAVADTIRRVFDNKAFKTKEVAASLSGNAVIVRRSTCR